MSMIYHKIRHRLNDDWAFGNGEKRNFSLIILFRIVLCTVQKLSLRMHCKIADHGICIKVTLLFAPAILALVSSELPLYKSDVIRKQLISLRSFSLLTGGKFNVFLQS